MSMTPEERGAAVADEMATRLVNDGWVAVVYGGIRMGWASAIAQAIRQAENDKLEAAAACFEQEDAPPFQCVEDVSASIRALKHKDT